MSDMASHSAPQPDAGDLRHTLSIHDVGAALDAAGVPRSRRQIIRYCETAMLDAVKVPGPTGAQWYVSPASIPKVIGDLKQWEAQRARQGAPQRTTASPVIVESARNGAADVASQGAPRPAAVADLTQPVPVQEPAMARYVEQLETRITEKDDVIGLLKGQLKAKDEQISELSTRYRETHSLLGAMQRMFAPLLGQGDPYTKAPSRQDSGGVDNPPGSSATPGV